MIGFFVFIMVLALIIIYNRFSKPEWLGDRPHKDQDQPEFTGALWYEKGAGLEKPIPKHRLWDEEEHRLVRGTPRTFYSDPKYEHATPQADEKTDEDSESMTLSELLHK